MHTELRKTIGHIIILLEQIRTVSVPIKQSETQKADHGRLEVFMRPPDETDDFDTSIARHAVAG